MKRLLTSPLPVTPSRGIAWREVRKHMPGGVGTLSYLRHVRNQDRNRTPSSKGAMVYMRARERPENARN